MGNAAAEFRMLKKYSTGEWGDARGNLPVLREKWGFALCFFRGRAAAAIYNPRVSNITRTAVFTA